MSLKLQYFENLNCWSTQWNLAAQWIRLEKIHTKTVLAHNVCSEKSPKTIYSQLSAKAASNMRRKQSSFVYVRDPFDFDQSESDEQSKSEKNLSKNTRKRQVRKNYS